MASGNSFSASSRFLMCRAHHGPLAKPVAWPVGTNLLLSAGSKRWHDRRTTTSQAIACRRSGRAMSQGDRRTGARTTDMLFMFMASAYNDDDEATRQRTAFASSIRMTLVSSSVLATRCALSSVVPRSSQWHRGGRSIAFAPTRDTRPSGRIRAPSPAGLRATTSIANYAATSLDDLVAVTGLTKAYIVSGFHRLSGVPPHRYQNLMRISARDRDVADRYADRRRRDRDARRSQPLHRQSARDGCRRASGSAWESTGHKIACAASLV